MLRLLTAWRPAAWTAPGARRPLSLASPPVAASARPRAAAATSRLGLLAGGLVAVGLLAMGTPAGAEQIGTLQAQANRLAAQIASQTERVGELTRQYDAATARQAAVSSELAAAQDQFAAIRASIGVTAAILRHEALSAYEGNDSASASMAATASVAMDLVLRRQYLEVANGNLADALDRYGAATHVLQAREATLRQDEASAASAAAAVTAARQSALGAAARADDSLAQVHGQLAQLVVAAEAAKTARASAPSPQGLPVNGGLKAAVTAAVSPQSQVGVPPPRASAAPVPVVAPVSAPAPAPAPVVGGGAGGVWAALRQCESSGNYAENTGNGYFGAYQFSQATWYGLGYPGRPDLAPPAQQDQAAQRLQASGGWGQWPACAAALSLS